MSHFLMKNLNIPKLSEAEKNAIKINSTKINPMREKGKKNHKISRAPRVPRLPVYKKKKIHQALREQVWLARFGRVFEHKCYVTWCKNTITVFDFESGHNIPESKGGATDLTNLYPICRKCNGSMGDRYSIDEWNALHTPIVENSVLNKSEEPRISVEPRISMEPNSEVRRKGWRRFFCCFT